MAKSKVENQLVTLSKQDFEGAGINVALTTNDMVEVIANEIFEKFVEHVHAIHKEYKDLSKEYKELFYNEVKELESTLKGLGLLTSSDNESDEVSYSHYWKFTGNSSNWTSVGVDSIKITEELTKGMIVKLDQNKSYFKMPTVAKSKFNISIIVDKDERTENVNINGITGSITTRYTKDFNKDIAVSTARFKEFGKKVTEYQQRVIDLFKILPANGVLTIERFTRDARVKMNKKLLASQGPEFKAKLQELYGIKL